jgi:amino acid transporter
MIDILKNFGIGVLVLLGVFGVCAIVLAIISYSIWFIVGGLVLGYIINCVYAIGKEVREYIRKSRC